MLHYLHAKNALETIQNASELLDQLSLIQMFKDDALKMDIMKADDIYILQCTRKADCYTIDVAQSSFAKYPHLNDGLMYATSKSKEDLMQFVFSVASSIE